VIALTGPLCEILQTKLGIVVRPRTQANEHSYDSFEDSLLRNFCRPLGLSGAQCDRMLFRNHDDIMTMDF
jgi:hypothetical protein